MTKTHGEGQLPYRETVRQACLGALDEKDCTDGVNVNVCEWEGVAICPQFVRRFLQTARKLGFDVKDEGDRVVDVNGRPGEIALRVLSGPGSIPAHHLSYVGLGTWRP